MILAVDVGGTNTRLAVLDRKRQIQASSIYLSRSHATLEEIIAAFLIAHPAKLDAICVAVAGPVKDRRAVVTNLPWIVSASQLAEELGVPRVDVINDHEATAWGIPTLSATDFVVLNEGTVALGNAAVIAAGTGLGQAGLFWNGHEHLPIPSEGGHADFAPRNQLEVELLQYLWKKLGKRVSYERALSGPGLVNLYSFLRDTGREEEPEWLAERLESGDAAAEISGAADKCPLAHQALRLFVSIYGAVAGNVALHFMAIGGLYIAGGIGPKIVARMKTSTFSDAYLDKGRLSPLLAEIPVRVIMNDQVALLGAAARTSREMNKPQ